MLRRFNHEAAKEDISWYRPEAMV